jgi:hypothetical protein
MFSGRKKKDFKTKSKPRVGRFKRLTLFGAVFALIFNVTIGPLSANVSAASIEAVQEAKAAQIEQEALPTEQFGSLSSTVVKSTTSQFGFFSEILEAITGPINAIVSFLGGIAKLGLCVLEFGRASPTSLPLALIGCPAIELIGGLVDLTEGILKGILEVKMFLNDSSSGNAMFGTWEGIRNVANIVFALILLIIIAATAFGSGEGFGALSNYSIKKMLPKVLVMAVAINTSFYLCAALADLSNIAGKAVGGIVKTATPAQTGNNQNALLGADAEAWQIVKQIRENADTMPEVVENYTATNAAIIIIILLAVILVVVMIIQLIVAVVLVAIRNIMLIALVILSPIAFVLGILPNTNKIFKKWFDYFGHMLLVYPAVMLLFAVSKLTADIIINASDATMMTLPLYLATLAAPVFFVKKVITSTSSAIGAVSSSIAKGAMAVVAVGAAVATGGATGAISAAASGGSKIMGALGGAAKGAAGQTGIGKTVMGSAEQIDSAKEKGAKKRLRTHLAGGKSLDSFNPQNKHEIAAKQEAQQQRAINAGINGGASAAGGFAGAAIGSSGGGGGGGASVAGGGTPNVHVEHGTVGSVNMPDGTGGDGAGSNNNSLEDLRTLLSGVHNASGPLPPGLTGDQQAAYNNNAADRAAATGAFSEEEIENIRNGTFTGTADDAVARSAAGMSASDYNNAPESGQQIIQQLFTETSQSSPRETNAAAKNLQKEGIEIKVNVDSNVKVEGEGKVDHTSHTVSGDGDGI